MVRNMEERRKNPNDSPIAQLTGQDEYSFNTTTDKGMLL